MNYIGLTIHAVTIQKNTDNKNSYKDRRKQLIMLDECNQIKELMIKHHGNITQVAAEMGFSRVTLYRKLRLYDI